ncbi:HAMP domain-containing sensor histidine kinase [Actinocorallia longicatena]|uniref:histidine kinase n=1 Tax=Actinocorallia longicatena TaxID=111803 RepID=A0ABP6QHN4_9ACTN
MRLSTRFAVCVAVLVPVLVALSGLLVLRLAVDDLASERDRHLADRLRALVPIATTYGQQSRRPRGAGEVLQERISAAATGDGGVWIEPARSKPMIVGTVPADLPAPSATPATSPDGVWRYATTPLGADGRLGRLWVFVPESPLAAQVSHLRGQLLLATLLAAAVGAVAGFGLGRIAVRPLSGLRRQAAEVDLRPGGSRLSTASGVTEIDDLARLVNDLLDRRDRAVLRTGEALETARAFAATAAHELRTPLTSMSANIGLLSHPNLSPEDHKEIVIDLDGEQARMQRLITMLRQLARGELLAPESFVEVDLAAVAGLAAEDAQRRHPDAVIVADLPEQRIVLGWSEGLRLVVDNLLDNAAIHGAGPGGGARVDLTVDHDGTSVLLRVRDHGPGIPADRHHQVFDRFSRRGGSPGSGLGMTLVRQQAVLHGGTAEIEPAPPGGGASILVRLPTSGRPSDPAGTLSWLASHER